MKSFLTNLFSTNLQDEVWLVAARVVDGDQGYSNDQWLINLTSASYDPLGVYFSPVFIYQLPVEDHEISSTMLGSTVGSILKYLCVFYGKPM